MLMAGVQPAFTQMPIQDGTFMQDLSGHKQSCKLLLPPLPCYAGTAMMLAATGVGPTKQAASLLRTFSMSAALRSEEMIQVGSVAVPRRDDHMPAGHPYRLPAAEDADPAALAGRDAPPALQAMVQASSNTQQACWCLPGMFLPHVRWEGVPDAHGVAASCPTPKLLKLLLVSAALACRGLHPNT
jgi:hypothetical protein